MKKVIVVSGKANSGKDTTIDFMIEYLESIGKNCVKMAFAKYLKDLCVDHLGWNGEKDEEGRDMLQYVGTDQIRVKLGWNEFHCNRVCEDIKIVEDVYDYVFICDARFENELYFTHSKFPVRFMDLLITNPNLVSTLDAKQLSHKSENGLGNYKHTTTIINDGSKEDLNTKAINYCIDTII
jgi:hypothetical protein